MKKKTKKIEIRCKYDVMLPIGKIKENPRNVNIHPKIQLKGLEKTLKENLIRHPLIVSKQSGHLVAGHARLKVMESLKMKEVPVVYQDFDNDEKEFQFMVADNESQRKSWLDPEQFQINIEELGLNNLGLENFGIFDELDEDIIPKQTRDNQEQETEKEPGQNDRGDGELPDDPKRNKTPDINVIHVYVDENYQEVINTLEYFKKKNEPITYSKIFLNALQYYRKNY